MSSIDEKRDENHPEKAEDSNSLSKVDEHLSTSPDAIIDIDSSKDSTSKGSSSSISFFTLFRFSTPLERLLDILALVAAAGAGTAQPLLSLVFGNLTQTFVNFGAAVEEQLLDPNSQDAQGAVKNAAEGFRHAAARDSLYLVVIGEFVMHFYWSELM